MGEAKLPGIAAEDIGRCAFGVFTRGEPTIGQSIGIAGEHLSGGELAAALSEALRERVRHADISPSAYRALGFPGADDLGNMFQFKRDFEREFRALRNVSASRELNPALQSFRHWLSEHRAKIPIT
jgi:hypothetical protein